MSKMRLGDVIVKADYIQNISHSRGKETSSSYFGKHQSQFLSLVVWYNKKNSDGTVTKYKAHFDYISSYLNHNSIFFQKAMLHLLTHLRTELRVPIKKVSGENWNSYFCNWKSLSIKLECQFFRAKIGAPILQE